MSVRCIIGKHPVMDSTGAIAEFRGSPDVALQRLRLARAELGWPGEAFYRVHRQGVTLCLPAPPDLVDCAADLLEWALREPFQTDLERLRLRSTREQNLKLRQVLATWPDASFVGDGMLTVGLGKYARSWSLDRPLPAHFETPRRIPVATITGTNGKTTTTRLLGHLVRCAGLVPGCATSGGVVVGEERVEPGDWTGPGGARRVLRDNRVEVGVLETARGGLLRRGMALTGQDVAVLTNVTQDHLGEWGVDTLEEMAAAKLLIAEALRPGGTIVVPLESEPIWSVLPKILERRPDLRVWRFSSRKRTEGWADSQYLYVGDARFALQDLPISFYGTARHNVENALAATLAALALGLPGAAIQQGLRSFNPSPSDNPGRMNCFRLPSGAVVVLDVAHTPDGIRRIIETLNQWPQTRHTLLLGQTGDRPDADIQALCTESIRFGARVILKEMPTKLFDRRLGEISRLCAQTLRLQGYPESLIQGVSPTEEAGVRMAIAGLGSQDLALLLIHESLVAAVDVLKAAGAVEA